MIEMMIYRDDDIEMIEMEMIELEMIEPEIEMMIEI